MLDFLKRHKILIIMMLISIASLGLIGLEVRNGDQGILFDIAIMEEISKRITLKGLDFFRIFTHLASAKFLIPGVILLVLFEYRKGKVLESIFLIFASLGTFGVNFVLKQFFTRTRPIAYFLIEEKGYSFPSGHAMVSMGFYTGLFYLLSRRWKDKKLIFKFLNLAIVLLVGYSRLYLGVHWPTDIAVGYIIGYTWYRFIRTFYEYFKRKEKPLEN